ncbi:MAG: vWA domain-containing protein [Rubripirellula sp.]
MTRFGSGMGAIDWVWILGPWGWLLTLVPIGIIALYFLKLRREPVEVSSTLLWGKTIQDLHVNSLLQRLRRSLLLFLQLLIVALAALAFGRPGIRGESSDQSRLIVLLDRSASMQATDLEDGASRFEKAKQLIRGRIESLSDDQTAMLIAFSDRAETIQSFTSDRAKLVKALDSVTVSNRTSDLLEALKAADGLANPRRSSQVGDVNDVQVAEAMPAELVIYSDGKFQDLTEFNLGNLTPSYVGIGSQTVRNLAITEFSTQQDLDSPGVVQVYATIMNLGTEKAESDILLEMNDRLIDAEGVALEPGEERGLAFELATEEVAVLTLTITEADDLAVDNRAYAGLSPSRISSVLVVTEGNTALSVGLATEKLSKICDVTFVEPGFLATEQYEKRVLAGQDDLIIYDGCRPSRLPNANTFFIGEIPPPTISKVTPAEAQSAPVETSEAEIKASNQGSEQGSGDSLRPSNGLAKIGRRQNWDWAGESSAVSIIDIDRAHPLFRYIELYSLLVFSGRPLNPPDGATEILTADIGPVMAIAPRGGYQDVVLSFPIVSATEDGGLEANTNWYAERSWPIFLFNLLRTFGNASESTSATSYRPGELVRGKLEGQCDELKVETSSGRQVDTVYRKRELQYETFDTNELGAYDVTDGGELVDRFAVNLFQPSESEIQTRLNLELGYEEVQSGNIGLVVRKEYWRPILLLLLVIVVMEWWVYTKQLAWQ